jgi:hypothetical protein
MNTEAIKSFLVGLGFGVDDASLAKFNKAIQSASLRVTALYTSVQVAAAGIFWSISKISQGFEDLGYEYRIIAPAINKAMILRRELLKAYSAAGVNLKEVVIQSVRFNLALTKTQYALKALYSGVAARFFPLLTKQIDVFRKNLYANMPKIQAMLEKFITFIFKAFEATITLGARVWSILQRVYDFFVQLDKATNGWSTIILAAVAAWKYLNLAFLATPLGMIIAGLVTLLALWDDFKTFQEGGQSLINWGSDTTKMFVGIAAAVATVVSVIYAAKTAMSAYSAAVTIVNAVMKVMQGIWLAARVAMIAFNIVAALNPLGAIVLAATALIGLLGVLIWKWDVVKKGFLDFFSGVGGKIMSFLGGSADIASNLKNVGGGVMTQPLGTNITNQGNTNQHVNQQTSINVMGAADAQGTASAIAGQQDRVNFNMTRNLKPRVQ